MMKGSFSKAGSIHLLIEENAIVVPSTLRGIRKIYLWGGTDAGRGKEEEESKELIMHATFYCTVLDLFLAVCTGLPLWEISLCCGPERSSVTEQFFGYYLITLIFLFLYSRCRILSLSLWDIALWQIWGIVTTYCPHSWGSQNIWYLLHVVLWSSCHKDTVWLLRGAI